MRVSLTHKFVVGALAVGTAVVLFPVLLHRSGLEVSPWVAPFVALGVGGALGFYLSRDLTRTFLELHRATEEIARGNLTPGIDVDRQPVFRDETHALASSIEGMVASLRALLEAVEELQVRRARELRWSWQQIAAPLGVSKQAVHQKYGKGERHKRRRV